MHVSVVGGLQQVNIKFDDVVDEIHQARAEISQDVKKEGELTREVIRQTSGKLLSVLHRYIDNAVNAMPQKSASVMPPTRDLI